jgi:hypothetical protein
MEICDTYIHKSLKNHYRNSNEASMICWKAMSNQWMWLLAVLSCTAVLSDYYLFADTGTPIADTYNTMKMRRQHSALIYQALDESIESRNVHICGPSSVPVIAGTKFALVSMLSLPG